MNKGDLDLLDLCMEDDLFCALYNALCYFGKEWHTAPAVELWAEALQARQRLHVARRPDLLIGQIFADVSAQEALLVEALLMWMLFTEDGGTAVSPLRESLGRLLMAHGEAWHSVYDKFRESEGQNEQAGYTVAPCDYRSKEIPAAGRKEGRADNESLAHELVTEALSTHSPEICRTLYYILARIDCQKGHIYESELSRLSATTDGLERMAHAPRMTEAHNHFAADSCRFEAGSTMNGNVTAACGCFPSPAVTDGGEGIGRGEYGRTKKQQER